MVTACDHLSWTDRSLLVFALWCSGARGCVARVCALRTLALRALALNAVAIGKLAIGQLALGRARLRRGQVNDLHIARVTVAELRFERVQ